MGGKRTVAASLPPSWYSVLHVTVTTINTASIPFYWSFKQRSVVMHVGSAVVFTRPKGEVEEEGQGAGEEAEGEERRRRRGGGGGGGLALSETPAAIITVIPTAELLKKSPGRVFSPTQSRCHKLMSLVAQTAAVTAGTDCDFLLPKNTAAWSDSFSFSFSN